MGHVCGHYCATGRGGAESKKIYTLTTPLESSLAVLKPLLTSEGGVRGGDELAAKGACVRRCSAFKR